MTKKYWLKDAFGYRRSFYVEDKIELSFNCYGWDDDFGKKSRRRQLSRSARIPLLRL